MKAKLITCDGYEMNVRADKGTLRVNVPNLNHRMRVFIFDGKDKSTAIFKEICKHGKIKVIK